jgi:hypothetical protein
MLRGDLARIADHALATAAIAYEQVAAAPLQKPRILAAIRANGVAVVETLYAPHTIEAVSVIARFDEERIIRLGREDAHDLVGVCCYLQAACDDALAIGEHLRVARTDLDAERFAAWTRGDHVRAQQATRAGEAVDELLTGVLKAGTAFAFPAARAALVRSWIAARADLA